MGFFGNRGEQEDDIFRSRGSLSLHSFFSEKKTGWVEETGIDGSKISEPGISRLFVRSSFTDDVGRMMRMGLFVLFFILFLRIGYLQIFSGTLYRSRALGNSERILTLPAERGLMYDAKGRLLVKNIPKFAVSITPQDIPSKKEERNAVIKKLAAIISVPEDDVRQELETYASYRYESVVLKDDITYEDALTILMKAGDLPGIRMTVGYKREYLLENDAHEKILSLSHIFGYMGKLSEGELKSLHSVGYVPSDSIGKTGIEKTYEIALRGTYGKKIVEVDARGREQNIVAENVSIPGGQLHLTIDREIQGFLETALNTYLRGHGRTRAAGVAMDPRTGAILALVSLPGFDDNDFSGGIASKVYQDYITNEDKPLFSRAVSGIYPSGSTIKPAIAAIALDRGIITPATTVLSNGGIHVGQWFFPDWKAGGHGTTNVVKALAWSVNTFFYYIGGGYNGFQGLGIDAIRKGLLQFGFASPLGIDLPGEGDGFLPSPEWKKETKGEQWYIGDTYNVSIGQGDILVTPLQIAASTMVVANGGTLYKPFVVGAIADAETGKAVSTTPVVVRDHISTPTSLAVVRQGMRECVLSGSCRRLSTLPFEATGKTGTAQWNSNKENHAWFTSFAPYQNPTIVLTILIEEGGGGSATAGPVAYDFYKAWWAYTQKNGQ